MEYVYENLEKSFTELKHVVRVEILYHYFP
jgi:hypothetical protein